MTNRAGNRLGNYRVMRLLGQGGFAEVYLAEHVFLKTLAAIKVLRVQLADEDIETFLKEARTIAGLKHLNIVRVLEFGIEQKETNEEGSAPFLVMDFAPNGTLRQRFPKGTIVPLETIVSCTNQIAAALQYAHDKKVIHRDVKPENLLLGSNNEVLLSDFGTAMVFQTPHNQSIQGMAGTANYMAPEQIRGKPLLASDQYALGVVIYEWLCGRCPFVGTFYDLFSQHIYAPVPPMSEWNLSILPDVEQVVLKALAKDPQQRFSSVVAFAQALQESSGLDLPTFSYAYSTDPRLPSFEIHEPPKISSMIDTTSSDAVSPRESDPSLYRTIPSPVSIDNSTLINTPKLTPSPQQVQVTHRISRRAVVGGLLGLGCVLIVGGGGAWLATSRHPSVHATTGKNTVSAVGTIITIYRGHTGNVYTAQWSPQGPRIASGGHDSTARVWNAFNGNDYLQYTRHHGSVNALSWSPGGQYIATASSDTTIHIWEAATGKFLFPYKGHTGYVRAVAWSPIGMYIASGGDDKTVQVWEASTGRHIQTYRNHAQQIWGIAWSHDGTRIASASADNKVRVWEATTGKDIFPPYSGHSAAVKAVAWSHNGELIASTGDDRTVQIWDAATEKPVYTYMGHSNSSGVYALAWSPDDKRIASGSSPQVHIWDATTGLDVYVYRGHSDDVHAVTWSPDGRYIASGSLDDTVLVWRAI